MTNRRVIVTLRGLEALANHGVYDFGHDHNQRFSADIVMWVETANTANDIAATVSYASIADEATAVFTGTAVDLIEALAETITSHVMSHEGIIGTEATIHKPDAPIGHPFADVSVAVRADQTDAAPLSLSFKGVYEAEDDSVFTGEIEAYGRAQAPSPTEQEQSNAPPAYRDIQAAHAAPTHNVMRPGHLRSRRVVLAIGGDLGNVSVTLMRTAEVLPYMEGFQIDDISPTTRTKPMLVPSQAPQPDYWNTIVADSAIAAPDELFAQTSRIERELGHERRQRWDARTVDIDIVQIKGLAPSDPVLTPPHPRAKEHVFVLAPWILYEPDAVPEGVDHVSDLLADTPDREGIIDAVDDWLEGPVAVVADSDQLLALRTEQANADMRELIKALIGEINQINDLVIRPDEPAEPMEIPAAHTVIEDSGDDVEEAADSESAPEQAREPEAAPVSAAETPAPRANIWSRPTAAQASDETSSAGEPEASKPELNESASHDVDVLGVETPATNTAAPAGETDATPQGEAPMDEAPTASAVPDPPRHQRRRRANEAKASSRSFWHPVSSVPADSPTSRIARKIGTGTYKPSGTKRPRWAPVFESKHEESRSKIALPDWNFSVGASHNVRVISDHSGLGRDGEALKTTVHADGRSTIPVPGLPNNTPVGLIPEEEAIQTGILCRVVVRPAMTGAIPIAKRRQMRPLSIT